MSNHESNFPLGPYYLLRFRSGIAGTNKTIKLKLDKYSGGIEIKSGSFKLQKRFEAKPYSSFTEAITKLESEVEKLQEKIESKDGGGRYVQ